MIWATLTAPLRAVHAARLMAVAHTARLACLERQLADVEQQLADLRAVADEPVPRFS